MKNILRITILGLALIGLNANASINIKSIELNNSLVINGDEISAITINDNDSSIESIETTDGSVIQGSLIKKIRILKPFSSKFQTQSYKKGGGEGSGG